MSKQTLIQDVITNGKYARWDELAAKHGLKSADIARKTWAKHVDENKINVNYIGKSGHIVHELRIEDIPKHTCSIDPVNVSAAQLDQAQYITELEDQIVKLIEERHARPKTSPANAFNIGYNPLDYSLELQKEHFLQEMKRNSLRVRTARTVKNTPSKDSLLELSIFDLHIGKLAWDKETGEDYDIEIATSRYRTAVEELLSRTNLDTIDRILLPIGNDMINVDGKTNTTTAGTPQSCDSRFGKMFRTARQLIIETVDRLTQVAPVDILVVPGNHDEVTMFTLGEVLDAWYWGNEDVEVFNEPKLRKYYKYGVNMIMFTHGDKERHADLGMIAATEQPVMWAETVYREVHMGHLHKSKRMDYLMVDEMPGFKVRILPSLSGTDAWHAGKGYMSGKAAESYVWHKTKGMISNNFYNV